jgi:hypothetical protein
VEDTEVLAKTLDYLGWSVKGVKERRLHSNNIKREEGFKLNQAWNPIIRLLWLSDADKLDSIQGDKLQDGHVKQWMMEIS